MIESSWVPVSVGKDLALTLHTFHSSSNWMLIPFWLHSVSSPIHFAHFPIPKRQKGNPSYWLQFTTLGGWVGGLL